ncbi:MAG: O-succinylbenzoic acid--CoA ligase [Maribacter sp.]|nr:MAG: O-succinylbenzoic acid--CoA ligase [Maribacter sp.]
MDIIHPRFKLNGISITYHDLYEVGYSLIKEGEPYQVTLGGFILDWIDKEDFITVKTSGSTGTPKNIRLGKQHMVNSALATGDYFDLYEGDKALLCLPGDYIAGKMMLVRAMVLGLDLDWVPPSSDPLRFLDHCYDFCAMVPVQLENSLDRVNHIKTLIVGGAPLSEDLKTKVQDKTTNIFETYGMTETITHIAVRKVNQDRGVSSNKERDHFTTLPNITIEKDERDCLVINAPDLDAAPIVTNDIVDLISDNEFELLGRYDNIINSGGIKLVPEQIERKLAPILKGRFFVTGIPDTEFGQKVTLIVEGKPRKAGLLEGIKALEGLGKYEVPRAIVYIPKFVEVQNGKVSRKDTLATIKSLDRE